MTEFEELALKKIAKDYLVDRIYNNINTLAGRYDISNAEISKHIGWDPAGFNQKYSRSNDLRITTFIKIYVALTNLIAEREAELGLNGLDMTKFSIQELITQQEIDVGALFNHISAAAEGKAEFLEEPEYAATYKGMKPFVLISGRNSKYNEREIGVYFHYFKTIKTV